MVAQGQKLTHLNERGEANMVDVGSKEITERCAVAAGEISMQASTLAPVVDGTNAQGCPLTPYAAAAQTHVGD